MKLNQQQIENLLHLVSRTHEKEINCNECFERLAEFAEVRMRNQPLSVALQSVEHHLSVCAECREEYEALRDALLSLESDEGIR
ncbi:MAG: hypothetical protein Fur0032_22550 [Terrimicrobiaceae bacterium]